MREQEFCDCAVIHEDIVDAVRGQLRPKEDYKKLAALFQIFSDGTRVQILHALDAHEMCVCDLAALLGISKSAASHQLRTLRIAGLVTNRREGQVIFYSLADRHVHEIIEKGFEHLDE